MVTPYRAGVAADVGKAMGLTADDVLGSPYALIGTRAAIAQDLLHRRERFGISCIAVSNDVIAEFAPIIDTLTR